MHNNLSAKIKDRNGKDDFNLVFSPIAYLLGFERINVLYKRFGHPSQITDDVLIFHGPRGCVRATLGTAFGVQRR